MIIALSIIGFIIVLTLIYDLIMWLERKKIENNWEENESGFIAGKARNGRDK